MKDRRHTPIVSDERIIALIEAYGSDISAYPEAEKGAAARRMAEAPGVFAQALEDACRLDDVLNLVPEVDVPASLRDSLIAGAPKAARTGRAKTGFSRFLPGWLPAGALASLAMGLLIGVNVSLPTSVANADTNDEAEAVMYAALGFGDYELMTETEQ